MYTSDSLVHGESFFHLFSRRRSEHTDQNVKLKPLVLFRTTPTHLEIIITWCYRKPYYIDMFSFSFPFFSRSCVGLISLPVEPDTLHAVMRVCLRFTRDHKMALLFAELGGPRMLLTLNTSSSFNGFSYLATILIRHVFEETHVLRHAMDKVTRTLRQAMIIMRIFLKCWMERQCIKTMNIMHCSHLS